jgi:hypothetical protein
MKPQKKWHQIIQCPPPDGDLKWHEYSCELTIPKDSNEVRVVLAAGWSEQHNNEAVTWFDAIYLRKIMVQDAVTPTIARNDTYSLTADSVKTNCILTPVIC